MANSRTYLPCSSSCMRLRTGSYLLFHLARMGNKARGEKINPVPPVVERKHLYESRERQQADMGLGGKTGSVTYMADSLNPARIFRVTAIKIRINTIIKYKK